MTAIEVEWAARKLETLCRERHPDPVPEADFLGKFPASEGHVLRAGIEAAVGRSRVLRLRRLWPCDDGEGGFVGRWYYSLLAGPARAS
jgi:hypothetical protein